MIRHICMFKLKEENKKENLEKVLKRAESLREISQIKVFQVVTNSKEAPDNNYDLSLIFDFASIEDLKEYQGDPRHVEFGKFITEIRDLRACIDYEF